MDRITKSLLDQFVAENSLDTLSESEAFEHFCGYLVTSEHYSETFSTPNIAVGAGGDCGIDCVAIIVNGSLVTNPEEIQDLVQHRAGRLRRSTACGNQLGRILPCVLPSAWLGFLS